MGGDSRSEETLTSFFGELTEAQRAGVEAVATDMAPGYRTAVELMCPRAVLACDLFHVVAKCSQEVIDPVCTAETKKRTDSERKWIKGSRYLLLRNWSTLWPDERLRLRALLDANEAINTVYILKDQLKRIWRHRRVGWARRALESWCELSPQPVASPSSSDWLVTSCGMPRAFSITVLTLSIPADSKGSTTRSRS